MRKFGRSFEISKNSVLATDPLPTLSRFSNCFSPFISRRGVATLTVKQLQRRTDSSEVVSGIIDTAVSGSTSTPSVISSIVNLNVWGRDVLFRKEIHPTSYYENISLNQHIIIDGQAPVFFKEEVSQDQNTPPIIRQLKFDIIKESEVSDSIGTGDRSISFTDSGSRYNLTYSITPLNSHEAGLPIRYVVPGTPAPNKGIFRLKSIICIDTTERTTDDLIVKLSDSEDLDKKLPQIHISKGEIEHFDLAPYQDEPNLRVVGRDYPFKTRVTVEMREADSGLRGRDDYLGTRRIAASESTSFCAVRTFHESDTKYHLIFDRLPSENDPNDNSYLFVVPKVFMANNSLKIWVGTFLTITKPVTITYTINGKEELQTLVINPNQWRVANPVPSAEDCKIYHFDFSVGVPANLRYEPNNGADTIELAKSYSKNNNSFAAAARLLPNKFTLNSSFEVILGSCYERTFDESRVSDSFKALYPTLPTIPNVKFFAGDQVYLDHPAKDFLKNTISYEDLAARFVLAYEETWESLEKVYSFGANYFISDDHEFYNNFPNDVGFMGRLAWLSLNRNPFTPDYLRNWADIAKVYFNAAQTTDVVQQFDIGKELSFFIADVRVNRCSSSHFIDDQNFNKIILWLNQLTSPGVLVLGQPILVTPNDDDLTLPNYTRQYKALVDAIANSKHDIIILSGDVHYSRFAAVRLAKHDKMLYEVISSPLSLVELTKERHDFSLGVVNSFLFDRDYSEAGAAAGWHIGPDGIDKYPEFFPPEGVATNHERKKIDYKESGTHSTALIPDLTYTLPPSSPSFSASLKVKALRTEENFAKIRFFKTRRVVQDISVPTPSGRVTIPTQEQYDFTMEVQCFKVRKKDRANLPELDWEKKVTLG